MADQAQSMRAVVAPRPGGPEALQIETRPRPDPGTREILVRVEAAGVNRPDVHQRQGNYPPPPGVTDILGLEIAGEVAALGPDAGIHRLGERVTALVPGGGYADYLRRPRDQRPADPRRASRQSRRPRSRRPISPSGPMSFPAER